MPQSFLVGCVNLTGHSRRVWTPGLPGSPPPSVRAGNRNQERTRKYDLLQIERVTLHLRVEVVVDEAEEIVDDVDDSV